MVVSGMAKKNISKKEVSAKAVSKKEVVQKNTSAKITTPKKMVKEAPIAEKKVNKVETKKVVVKPEMDNFMAEEKISTKEIALKIWDVVFWVLFAVIACIWIVDFFRVKSEKEPMFCLNKTTIEYKDGTVSKCTGLGYKVYNYNRTSLDKGLEFGPFFIKMKK